MKKTSKKTPRFRRIAPDERRKHLVEAGLACLAKGGIAGFTVDNICEEAAISRGLIVHHFGSKDGLLTAVYAEAYDRMLAPVIAPAGPLPLEALIDSIFSKDTFNSTSLSIWLALWGEIANKPALRAEHRRHYALYRASVAKAVAQEARRRKLRVDSQDIATALISLVDGLWLEQCIDKKVLSAQRAKLICRRAIEAWLTVGVKARVR